MRSLFTPIISLYFYYHLAITIMNPLRHFFTMIFADILFDYSRYCHFNYRAHYIIIFHYTPLLSCLLLLPPMPHFFHDYITPIFHLPNYRYYVTLPRLATLAIFTIIICTLLFSLLIIIIRHFIIDIFISLSSIIIFTFPYFIIIIITLLLLFTTAPITLLLFHTPFH